MTYLATVYYTDKGSVLIIKDETGKALTINGATYDKGIPSLPQVESLMLGFVDSVPALTIRTLDGNDAFECQRIRSVEEYTFDRVHTLTVGDANRARTGKMVRLYGTVDRSDYLLQMPARVKSRATPGFFSKVANLMDTKSHFRFTPYGMHGMTDHYIWRFDPVSGRCIQSHYQDAAEA